MKKNGFTLAELLIAIGIIGIVAAVTAPQLNKLLPDENKSKVLKAYKALNDINEENEVWNGSWRCQTAEPSASFLC